MSYRDEVLRTVSNEMFFDDKKALTNGALGLCGESGEVADLVKKHIFHGAPIDREKLVKELGDVRWYFEVICIVLGVTREEVEAQNVLKLRKRYPNGFNPADAAAKRDEAVTEEIMEVQKPVFDALASQPDRPVNAKKFNVGDIVRAFGGSPLVTAEITAITSTGYSVRWCWSQGESSMRDWTDDHFMLVEAKK